MACFKIRFDDNGGDDELHPKTLMEMSAAICASNFKNIFFNYVILKDGTSKLEVKPDIGVPAVLLEKIIDQIDHAASNYIQMITAIAAKSIQTKTTWLKSINLNGCNSLTDAQLEEIMKAEPTKLQIHDCPLLTGETLKIINKYGSKLEALKFGNSAEKIFSDYFNKSSSLNVSDGLLRTPKLRWLTLWNMKPNNLQNKCRRLPTSSRKRARLDMDFFEWLTRNFISKLEYLDLQKTFNLHNLDFLLKANKTLQFLNLRKSVPVSGSNHVTLNWEVLANLAMLRYLNISACPIEVNETNMLKRIIGNLPNLEQIHLSATQNLTASKTKDRSNAYTLDAFENRENNNLRFVQFHEEDPVTNLQIVPGHIVVFKSDRPMCHLVKAIQVYNEAKLLSESSINFVQSICVLRKENNEGLAWRKAALLLLQVIESNLTKLDVVHPLEHISYVFHIVFNEPGQLNDKEIARLLMIILQLFHKSWTNVSELNKLISILNKVSRKVDVWKKQNAKIVVSALLHAARITMTLYEEGLEQNVQTAPDIFRQLNSCFSENLTEELVMHMKKSDSLYEELQSFVIHMNKMKTNPPQLGWLYLRLWQKFLR